MKKIFTLLLLCCLCIGSAWGEGYTELFHISSGSVVSGTSYKAHSATVEKYEWLVTFGGNNTSLGTNSSNRSKCNLSSYEKYAVSPVTTSSTATAFVSLSKIDDVSKISYEIGGSGKNQSSTNVYLIYSADGNTFSQISLTSGTQGATISSSTVFEFAECSGYFGLLFSATNSSGDWRIDGVTMNFYKVSSSTSTKTLTGITVSGTPTKTTYEAGESFDPAGLIVTGTYDDESTSEITSGITWNYNQEPLAVGTSSIEVTATVEDITSDAYSVAITVDEAPETTGYELVTDASSLAAGNQILIVGIESDTYYALKPYVSGNNCGRNEVSAPVNNVISTDVADITLGGAEGAWTLFDGTYYLYAAGGTGSNYLKGAATAGAATAQWTIACDAGGKATIKCVDTNTSRNTLRHNTGSDIFSCYASGQADVYIYKKVGGTTAPTISCADITGVSYEGVIDAVAIPTFYNNDGWTALVTCDGTVVASATLTTDNKITYAVSPNPNAAARNGSFTITLTKDGEDPVVKEVTVSQSAAPKTYASLAALVEAGEPKTEEVLVQVTLTNEVIKNFFVTNAGNTSGVYLQVGEKEIEIYCPNVPTDWVVGGTLSGTITCPWKKFGSTWELCPTSWDDFTYTAPTALFNVIIAADITNGSVTANPSEAVEGQEITLTVTPDDGYKLTSLTIEDATGAPVTVTNNTFTMPASDVTVSATFVEKVEYTISWSANGEVYTTTKVYEGDALALPDVDVESVGDYTFCGWIASEYYSSESTAPEFIVPANTHPTADATYYAVFAKATSGGESNILTINSETTNFPTSYANASDYTLEGISFNITQAYINGEKLQWRANGNKNGTGTMYNNEALGNIQSVTLLYQEDDVNKNFTLNVGNTANPTDGTSISAVQSQEDENKYVYDCSNENANYFVLTNGTNAGYLTSITIEYGAGVTYSDYCTTVEVPQPSIECETTLELAASESEVETLNVTWTDVEEMDIVLYSDATCEMDFDGNWFVADLNEDNNVEYYASENTETEPRIVYMQLYALDADANVITKVVTVTQAAAQPSTVYASLADLVAAGEPTTEGQEITLTLNDDEITDYTRTSAKRTGIVLTANNREVFVHCTNGIGDKYNTGGFVSGTVSGTWKESFVAENWRWTLELSQTEFANLSCAYPVTINTSGRGTAEARVTSEGSESYNTPATKVNAGAAAGILMTPEEGWEFGSVSFDDSNLAIDVNSIDNTTVAYFTMPAKPVTVTVEFEQVAVEDANVIMTWEGSEELFKVEKNGTVTLKESDETLGKLTKLEITENIENVNVNYVRKFGTHNLQPWFVPFDYVVPANSDLTFAEIWNAHVDETGKTDYFEYVIVSDGETIPANTPYLVWLNKNSETKQYEFTSTSTLYKTEPISIDCATTKHTYTFEGTYANVKLMENNFWYVREGQMSYTNNSDLELSPYRWHMLMATKSGDAVDPNTLFGTTSQSIKFHNAFGDDLDDADAISEIKTDAVREGAYDLMGRKVTSLVKGNVYIINGKKTYIR